MSKHQKLSLFLLRVILGWMYFYSGITKILNPAWSAQGYLENVKAFKSIYGMFLQPSILPVVNFINEWALAFLGASLILGLFIRISTMLGIVLMLLYYFPLGFPYITASLYIVDQHIIYIISLALLGTFHAGRVMGLDGLLRRFFQPKKNPE